MKRASVQVHVVGLRGAGKTTFAHWLAQQLRAGGHGVELVDGGRRKAIDSSRAETFSPASQRRFRIDVRDGDPTADGVADAAD